MKRLLPVLLIVSSILTACATEPVVPVVIHTGAGTIDVAIDTVAAPITSANFLRYIREGLYDGGEFFRVVRMDNQPNDSIRIEVIQGGANLELNEQFHDPIPLERTSDTGLLHEDGTISMARGRPNSATHSFFFTIGDQPSLDFGGMRNPDGQGFAAFGKVTRGMDVVRAIQSGDVEAQLLMEPVSIDSIRIK
jgi:peptidyl-prolyl cis-trans isomerase A (cyclophilin A)